MLTELYKSRNIRLTILLKVRKNNNNKNNIDNKLGTDHKLLDS